MKRALLCVVLLAACKPTEKPPAGGGPPKEAMRFPVEVAPVEARRVEYSLSAVGALEAFERVLVTARVPGAIDAVHFQEGTEVKARDLLVEIETRRYAVAERSARAAVVRAKAVSAEAASGVKRREDAEKESAGVVPAEELGTWRSRVRTAAADIQAASAALERAKLDLEDARVTAPIDGTIQSRTAEPGQYVQAGAVLATLVRDRPLLVRFQVPEGDAMHVHKDLHVALRAAGAAQDRDARVTWVAAESDPTTRLVAVRAEVGNPEGLRPGTFADVTIPVAGPPRSPVVPQTAVRPSERGFLAFVVKDGVAEERVLTLGLRTADGRIEVRSGLTEGEALVVHGAEALRPGAPVVVDKPRGEKRK